MLKNKLEACVFDFLNLWRIKVHAFICSRTEKCFARVIGLSINDKNATIFRLCVEPFDLIRTASKIEIIQAILLKNHSIEHITAQSIPMSVFERFYFHIDSTSDRFNFQLFFSILEHLSWEWYCACTIV